MLTAASIYIWKVMIATGSSRSKRKMIREIHTKNICNPLSPPGKKLSLQMYILDKLTQLLTI